MNAGQKPYAGNPHVRFDEGLLARASCTAGWGLLDRPWRHWCPRRFSSNAAGWMARAVGIHVADRPGERSCAALASPRRCCSCSLGAHDKTSTFAVCPGALASLASKVMRGASRTSERGRRRRRLAWRLLRALRYRFGRSGTSLTQSRSEVHEKAKFFEAMVWDRPLTERLRNEPARLQVQ
jgi:hypothetical protein